MNNQISGVSLYNKHKEERYNYRLAQDLKKHNWLLKKLEAADTKPTKKEKNILKRLSKKMENVSGKQLKKTTENLEKVNKNKRVGISMPNITDLTKKTEKEVEPLGILRITQLKKSEIIDKPRKPLFTENTTSQLEGGQSSAGNKTKHIPLSAPASQPKNWFETKEVSSKHNLPIEIAPEMKKYRDLNQPANNDQNVCLESKPSDEDILMIKVLHSHDINTVEKLIHLIESRTAKVNEEDSKINTDACNEVILEEEIKLKEKESDEVEFVKEEIFPKKEVSPEAIDAAVALSDENKKIINLCSSKLGYANILKLITDSNYNEEVKNKLEEVLRTQTNQLTVTKEPVSVTDTPSVKRNEIPEPQNKTSQKYYVSTENQDNDVENNYLVIEVNNNQVEELNNNLVVEGYQPSEDIGNQLIDGFPQIREDISHNVEDMGYQAKDSNSEIEVPVVEDLQTQEKVRPLIFQENEKQVSQDSSISAAIGAVNNKPKSTKDDSLSVTKNTPNKRRRTPQMENGGLQPGCPSENKRLFQNRDPRYNDRPKDAEKPENSSHQGSHMPPGFLSSIRPAAFCNTNAGTNENIEDTNNSNKSSNNGTGPYHPSNPNYNGIVNGNQYEATCKPANFENHKNIATDCMSKYPPYGNTATYAQNTHNVVKRYDSGNNNMMYPHNHNANYNSNSQANVTCSHSGNIFNTSRNTMSGGGYAQNSEAMGLGDVRRLTYNNFHNPLNVNPVQSTPFTSGARLNGPFSNNDPRRLPGQNPFWGSRPHLPPQTTINNSTPQFQWPATCNGNLTGSNGITPAQCTHAPTSSTYNYCTDIRGASNKRNPFM